MKPTKIFGFNTRIEGKKRCPRKKRYYSLSQYLNILICSIEVFPRPFTLFRLKHAGKKKRDQNGKARKEAADYVQEGKLDRAKIRVEEVIRNIYTSEAMEAMEIYCETLITR